MEPPRGERGAPRRCWGGGGTQRVCPALSPWARHAGGGRSPAPHPGPGRALPASAPAPSGSQAACWGESRAAAGSGASEDFNGERGDSARLTHPLMQRDDVCTQSCNQTQFLFNRFKDHHLLPCRPPAARRCAAHTRTAGRGRRLRSVAGSQGRGASMEAGWRPGCPPPDVISGQSKATTQLRIHFPQRPAPALWMDSLVWGRKTKNNFAPLSYSISPHGTDSHAAYPPALFMALLGLSGAQ